MKNKPVYQILENTEKRTAEVRIYGPINSNAEILKSWYGEDKVTDVSAFGFAKAIEGLDVDELNVCINSYGGEVAEALAIYSVLKRHKAKVHTIIDGFCCSAATIVFCAGATRTIGKLSLMMIHNCRSYVGYSDSEGLRKAAETNDTINGASIAAYKAVSNLPETEIRKMMNKETWLDAAKCVEYGFATDIADDEDDEDEGADQDAFQLVRNAVLEAAQEEPSILARIEEEIRQIRQRLTPEPDLPEEDNKRIANYFANMI